MTKFIDACLDLKWLYTIAAKNKPAVLKTKYIRQMYCILKGFKSYRNCVVHCYLYNWGFYKEDAPTIKNQFKYVLELFEILGNSKVVIRLENILPNTEYKEAIIKIFRKLHKENINIPVKINFCTNYISKAHYKKLKIDFVNSLKNSKWGQSKTSIRQHLKFLAAKKCEIVDMGDEVFKVQAPSESAH